MDREIPFTPDLINSKGYRIDTSNPDEYPTDGNRYRRFFFSDGQEDFGHLDKGYTWLDKNDTTIKVGDKVKYELDYKLDNPIKGIGRIIEIFHTPPIVIVRCGDDENRHLLSNRIIEMDNEEFEKIEELNWWRK